MLTSPLGSPSLKSVRGVDVPHPRNVARTDNSTIADRGSGSNPSDFWFESIDHNSISPFIDNGESWKVFRNVVKDYGADPTGQEDATEAIRNAITGLPRESSLAWQADEYFADGGSSGSDRGSGDYGTTGQPAVIYLPSGN